MAQHKEERIGFGELPVALRQAVHAFVFDRESAANKGLAVSVQVVDVQIAYEVQIAPRNTPRTDLDVVREVHESIAKTGGCPGVVSSPGPTGRKYDFDPDSDGFH